MSKNDALGKLEKKSGGFKIIKNETSSIGVKVSIGFEESVVVRIPRMGKRGARLNKKYLKETVLPKKIKLKVGIKNQIKRKNKGFSLSFFLKRMSKIRGIGVR